VNTREIRNLFAIISQPAVRHLYSGTECRVWLSRRLEVSATGNRCVLCFGGFCDPLPNLGLGLGLGGPWVAQASPKGGPREAQRVDWKKRLLFATKTRKWRVGGGAQRAPIAEIARDRRHRRDRKASPILKETG